VVLAAAVCLGLFAWGWHGDAGLARAAPLGAPAQQDDTSGWAALVDDDGRTVGVATFTEDWEGVQITVLGTWLPPGAHGIHIHAVGRCDPPTFTGAGGHFDPGHREHGLHDMEGPHAGDLPNLIVEQDGTAIYYATNPLVTLGLGNPAALLFDGDGSALVIHAQADDQISDDSGHSGARIACGEIIRS
jgi:Cu-Zn family superoxide dismutase